MDMNDETQTTRESSPAEKTRRAETIPESKEDPVKEFQEYLLDIGVRI